MKHSLTSSTRVRAVSAPKAPIRVRFAREAIAHLAIRFEPITPQLSAMTGVQVRKPRHGLSVLLGAIVLAFTLFAGRPAQAALPGVSVDLAVLVVAATPEDGTLPSIRQALDILGTPYAVHVATAQPGGLTADKLFSGTKGRYSGVILTTGSLGYSPDGGASWLSGLTWTEWLTLWQYQADFGVRQVSWYTYPTADYGFGTAISQDTTGNPLQGTWTTAARSSFPYVNTATGLAISNAYAYLAFALDADTTVWLQSPMGHALMAVKKYPDGRENLALTFDSAQWLLHSTVISHGVVTWLNRGLFLGERRTYLSAQVDDVFIADDIYPTGEYRQNAADWQATRNWQNRFRLRPSGRNFRLDMAYNGEGTLPGQYPDDDLTPAARASQADFKWINHTFTHPYLDAVSYAEALNEIVQNNSTATSLGLSRFSRLNLVTPNITGLDNPQFIKAAYDSGIRYLVTDTSIPRHRPPSPNVGLPNWVDPRILMIPRHANNLFYNVSTPQEWMAEYNFLYAAYWGRNLSYAEILDNQSDLLLGFLLKGDISPLMFHQPNLRDFNGQGNTLLGDLLDATATKYERYYNFPFLSPTMDALGMRLKDRMAYNASGVTATRNANNTVTIRVVNAATVPVTGLRMSGAAFYGGQYIASVKLAAGQAVTITLP